jgi:hypothetical protein
VSRGTGVAKIKLMSKCNGGVEVPKISKNLKPFTCPLLTSKSLTLQLKITFICNNSFIIWGVIHSLYAGDI